MAKSTIIITPELALRIRERGLLFDGGTYSIPRLKKIADRQKELMEEMERLDKELEQMTK